MAVFSRKSEKSSESSTPMETSSTAEGSPSVIGQGNTITGNLECGSDIRIDGTLYGDITTTGKLILGQEGKVEGKIYCAEALIQGQIYGVIHVEGLLEIRESAHIDGELITQKLQIHSGAIFNGTAKMGGNTLKGFDETDSHETSSALIND